MSMRDDIDLPNTIHQVYWDYLEREDRSGNEEAKAHFKNLKKLYTVKEHTNGRRVVHRNRKLNLSIGELTVIKLALDAAQYTTITPSEIRNELFSHVFRCIQFPNIWPYLKTNRSKLPHAVTNTDMVRRDIPISIHSGSNRSKTGFYLPKELADRFEFNQNGTDRWRVGVTLNEPDFFVLFRFKREGIRTRRILHDRSVSEHELPEGLFEDPPERVLLTILNLFVLRDSCRIDFSKREGYIFIIPPRGTFPSDIGYSKKTQIYNIDYDEFGNLFFVRCIIDENGEPTGEYGHPDRPSSWKAFLNSLDDK